MADYEHGQPADASPEMKRLVKDAVVGATAPERTSEEPGLSLSGGEENPEPHVDHRVGVGSTKA